MDTLVVDVGSSSTKAGWGGEDSPSFVFPTLQGDARTRYPRYTESAEEYLGGEQLASAKVAKQYKGVLEAMGQENPHPLLRGSVKNWDHMEKFWKSVLEEINIASQSDSTNVLLVESPKTTVADRREWAEIIFDAYRAPSLAIGNSSSCAMFAAGRTTGVVVDCGAGLTSCVPVFEGLALTHAVVMSDYGGQDLTALVRKNLGDRYGKHLEMTDALTVKERYSRVLLEASRPPAPRSPKVTPPSAALSKAATATSQVVALPDGTEVSVSGDFFAECTETLLVNSSLPSGGLISQVHESLSLCDDSIRRDLCSNIIIAGGTAMMAGLGDRLGSELDRLSTADAAVKGYAPMNIRVMPSTSHKESGYTYQRKHAAWIGGSIMSSLESFRDLKITRQEWEEGSGEQALLTKSF